MEGFCKQKHLRQPLVSELPDGFALLMHHIRGRASRVTQCDTTSAKQKDRSKSCLFVLAEMSGFEPPRRLSRPTPLAGAPLRPLEYISKCTQPRLHKPPFRSLPFNYTQFYSDCQYLFVFSLISFQNASISRTTNGCPYDQNQRTAPMESAQAVWKQASACMESPSAYGINRRLHIPSRIVRCAPVKTGGASPSPTDKC